MSNKIGCVVFLEAGHAIAHILTEIPFKYVTIKEDKEKDKHGQRSPGHILS